MDIKMVVEKGTSKAQVLRLKTPETLVGRQDGCGLRIPSSLVSRRHCVLRFRDDFLTVEDLNSSNGTLLNGVRIQRRELVRPGDRLEIGPLVFLVKYQLTQNAIERLLRGDIDLEEEEFVPAIPFSDETETLPADLAPLDDPTKPAVAANDQDDVIDGSIFLDETEPWQMPAENDLRNILFNLDDKKPK